MNKKEMATISAMYKICASSIIMNSTQILLLWKRRKRRRNNLKIQLLNYQLLINSVLINNLKRQKRSTNKKRSYEWWDKIVNEEFSEKDCLENFRVGNDTFKFIVEELKEELKAKENMLNNNRIITCPEKKVAVALFYLANVCEYRVVGHTFGIHKSTVHNIVHEFVNAVINILLPKYINMPSEAEATEIASIFERSTHLPNIIGAIGGTHIPVKAPMEGHRDFINSKSWTSVILQGVVDSKYRFIDICVNNPGSTHEAAVLAGSNLYKNIHNILPKSSVYLGSVPVPYVILGDPAYPLLPWLIKPYADDGITPEQDSYNVHTSAGKVVIDNAFARLKARWRRLIKQCDINYKFMPKLVAACCTLHNIVETRMGHFSSNWMDEVENADIIFPQPLLRTNISMRDSYEAHNLREQLCNYLKNRDPSIL